MKVFYIIVVILFLILLTLYLFMSIRLNILSKKKEKLVRSSWKQNDIAIVDAYKKATRVSMKEIFLGLDNGKTSSK